MIEMIVNRFKSLMPMERMFVATAKRYVNLVNEDKFRNTLREAEKFMKGKQEAIVTLGM